MLLLFVVMLNSIYVFNKRIKNTQAFDWHSQQWADKVGYNVYLPFVLIYNADANKMPDSIEYKTGIGFGIDKKNNKLVDKYPQGVALMQLPFFIGTHINNIAFNKDKSGFSLSYIHAIYYASVFYAIIGLIFFYLILLRFSNQISAFISAILIYFGTNLWYYSTIEAGMSHIYLFCSISISLYFFLKWRGSGFKNKNALWIAIIAFWLSVSIRNTSIIFLPILFLLGTNSVEDLKKIFQNILKPSRLALILFIGLLLFLPTFLYNYYLHGSILAIPYPNESFSHLLSPEISAVLFTPDNGLFPYTPIAGMAILLTLGLFFYKKNSVNASISIIIFVLITYLYASWSSPHLGCAYSQRGYTEWAIIFALPINALLFNIRECRKTLICCVSILVMLSAFNYILGINYDLCWFGKNEWDWAYYKEIIHSGFKFIL